jgi:hypothetical protein
MSLRTCFSACNETPFWVISDAFIHSSENPICRQCFIGKAVNALPDAHMVRIRDIGVRLDGRICNTMKAFELSEQGIKPGLTVVLKHTQKRMLDLIRHRRHHI